MVFNTSWEDSLALLTKALSGGLGAHLRLAVPARGPAMDADEALDDYGGELETPGARSSYQFNQGCESSFQKKQVLQVLNFFVSKVPTSSHICPICSSENQAWVSSAPFARQY